MLPDIFVFLTLPGELRQNILTLKREEKKKNLKQNNPVQEVFRDEGFDLRAAEFLWYTRRQEPNEAGLLLF